MATPLNRSPAPDLDTDPIPKQRYTSKNFARLELELAAHDAPDG